MELQGKVALVTGSSRGVGAAIAVSLAQAGCAVACAARSTDAAPQRTPGTLDRTVGRITAAGGRALAVQTNLADDADVVRMVRTTVDHFGRLDVLVNNAAITFIGDLDVPMKRYDLVMAVNTRAPFLALREAVPHMKRQGGGAVLSLSSVAALFPYPGLMAYGMSKIALERMTVDAARQLQRDGIAVNVFRIDVPVWSEGFAANAPGLDQSDWEPPEVAAEGILWVLRQPTTFSGELLSMHALRQREGIMASRAKRPFTGVSPQTLHSGLVDLGETVYREPY
jgi:NAD(P)-dependent dehydrogenase (short-subunit alcohol dehydrogenase family)